MNTGKVSGNVLKRSVLRQLTAQREEVLNGAGIGKDCAILSFSDDLTVTCMQEAVVAVSESQHSDINTFGPRFTMSHLIQKCANNLAAAGAKPVAAMITLLLPDQMEEAELKALMAEADRQCSLLSMAVAGGQSRVTKAVSFPVAVVAGIGRLSRESTFKKPRYTAAAAEPGQDVVVSKWIGLEGTAFLAHRCREELLERYPAYLVEEAMEFCRYLSVLPEAFVAVKSGVRAMHDASEGGIFAALWELAEGAGVGLTIDLKKLPLKQETVEICECCGVNPYELLSGGCLVMTADDGPGLVNALCNNQIPAVIVGKVTDDNSRILLNEDEVRYMDRPKTDELYRFYEENQ